MPLHSEATNERQGTGALYRSLTAGRDERSSTRFSSSSAPSGPLAAHMLAHQRASQ